MSESVDLEWVKEICKGFCSACPSYKGSGETELGFCFTGKSSKIRDEVGCICASCPVQAKYSLKGAYYCTRGSEVRD